MMTTLQELNGSYVQEEQTLLIILFPILGRSGAMGVS